MADDEKMRNAADEKMVNDAFQHLIDTYQATRHRKKTDIITKAFNFARQAHKGVRRLSGEPYIMHPIAVAQIAAEEVGLGSTSICAALLHDVVEDTDYTVDDISNMFGEKVAMIVDGLTKISGGIFGEKASAQAENFKKLLLTMSDDIRVILIKICDRLHNMRTLASQAPNKQYKIAGETLYIYAPLANRLGLNKIKSELENLSFKYEHPEKYQSIVQKLADTEEKRHELFDSFTRPIEESLKKMGIKYTIKERVKTPYSIWNKMQNKHVTFEEIYDILAVRIIFTPQNRENEINECFNIYVALTKLYQSHPDRLRDWLNHPKANGYQALQVTLMSKQGRWIEVQIRSDRMDEVAEQGFAAHWKYKDGETAEFTEDESELNDWLNTIKEILDDPQPDAMDFLDAIKLNLFSTEIFVFTPKGEIKIMPADCTALDFAFSIHTFLGSHCIGAKVNHKLVPLSHKLKSGDQVEILTAKAQHVQPSWINFVYTAKAKAKIQAILRHETREIQKIGENTLNTFLKNNEIEYSSIVVDRLAALHDIKDRNDFFRQLGEKTIILGEKDIEELFNGGKNEGVGKKGWRKYVPFLKKSKKKLKEEQQKEDELFVVTKDFNKKKPIIITDDNIRQYRFMHCCSPIPGDDILGFIDSNNRIEIHKRSCKVASKLKTSYGNRILDAKWEMHGTMFFEGTVQMNGVDRIGLLHDVVEVISNELNVDIKKVDIDCNDGLFDAKFTLRIHDRNGLQTILKNLKNVEGIESVVQLN